MLQVGVVGLGKMGMLHLLNCRHIDGISVVAAADRSKRSLKKAKELGVTKLYPDYQDMFSSSTELDAVIISVPNFLHLDAVQLALEEGINVSIT